MELPDVPALAQTVGDPGGQCGPALSPGARGDCCPRSCVASGSDYLARTRIQRKTDRPFFIDKLPNNFLHTGFIHLMLPNAHIIDARRHPLGCCFSAFKQHFARGQNFTYDLGELAAYYRAYVELMAHFDRVLPGRVHRVLYERMVGGHRGRGARPARPLRAQLRAGVPALLRKRARRAHGELGAGALADLPRRHGAMAPFRALARAAQGDHSVPCWRCIRGRPDCADNYHQRRNTTTTS